MKIKRDRYLKQLIAKQWNGQIKIITGIRRCGKSVLLFDLFRDYLLQNGVKGTNIISLALDDNANKNYRNPDVLSQYVLNLCSDQSQKYYVLLDEIQYAITKEELRNTQTPVELYGVLVGFLNRKNIDVYITGSNSRLLSSDIRTEFRGRGDKIHVYPLSFQEYFEASGLDKWDAYNEYILYGGMPRLLQLGDDTEKYNYLDGLFEEIYFRDIEERYQIRLPNVLRSLTDDLCSSVGSLTNAAKIAASVNTHFKVNTNSMTISQYLSYLEDSFLFSRAQRYDVKGKRYFEYPSKYYCTDIGLRNIRIGLRQQEESHILENLIYNELCIRGYAVDVGLVTTAETNQEGKQSQKGLEVDFIAHLGPKQYYIQVALNMDDEEKQRKELRPLLAIHDSFRKVVISKSYGKSWVDDQGILRLSVIDFLLDEHALDR